MPPYLVQDDLGDIVDGGAGVDGLEIAQLGVVGDDGSHGLLEGDDAFLDDFWAIIIADDEFGALFVTDACDARGL